MSFVMDRDALDSVVRNLSGKGYEVYGPVRKGPEFVFNKISQARELALGYVTTILSPRKYLYPPSEKLFSYNS